MSRLIILIAALVGVYLLLRWFVRTPPAVVARTLQRVGLLALLGVILFLAATGRLNWLFAALVSLIALAMRLSPLLRYLPWLGGLYARHKAARASANGAGSGAAAGQKSEAQTRYLRMTLDHQSGEIEGEVLAGSFQGWTLGELGLEDLTALLGECRVHDTDSVQLLEAYLDRRFGPDWGEHVGNRGRTGSRPSTQAEMSREEAYEILGLAPEASEAEIIAAHRRLMQKLHPDRGGSTYLAARINRAKDLLLRH